MPNRVYPDLNKLRVEVNDLIDRGQVVVHHHARKSHPEFTDVERIAVVRFGGRIQRDRSRRTEEGVYVCWAQLPSHGLCRAVFCVGADLEGDYLLIITVFGE